MKNILYEAIQEIHKKENEEIKKTVSEFLAKEGYVLEDSFEGICKLQDQLAEEGKKLRVEVFTKMSGKLSVSMVILPFFQPLDQEISRVEIYRMLNLAEQGYQI